MGERTVNKLCTKKKLFCTLISLNSQFYRQKLALSFWSFPPVAHSSVSLLPGESKNIDININTELTILHTTWFLYKYFYIDNHV